MTTTSIFYFLNMFYNMCIKITYNDPKCTVHYGYSYIPDFQNYFSNTDGHFN